MSGVFEQEIKGARFAETHYGDTMQAFALRELGDANRWPEIVWLNKLLPPYLTDDPLRAEPGVVLTGAALLVPAPKNMAATSIDPDLVFERDCDLRAKRLEADDGGDFAVVAGRANLKQQLVHRVNTIKGELQRHPDYGCNAGKLIGVVNGPVAAQMAAQYVKAALLSDFRVSKVTKSVAAVVGDSIRPVAEIVPISGRPIEITTGA